MCLANLLFIRLFFLFFQNKVLPPTECAREEFSHRVLLDAPSASLPSADAAGGSGGLDSPGPTDDAVVGQLAAFVALWCRDRGGTSAEAFFKVQVAEVL